MDLREQLGLTVIMITHDLDTIFRTCNRVGVIIDRKMTSDTLAGHQRAIRIRGSRPISTASAPSASAGLRLMEREANYTAVGAFVLLIATMAGAVRVLVRGQQRRARLRALRDLFRGQRLGPESRQHGALPRRRGRPRGRHPDRQARLRPRAGHRRHRFAYADLEGHAGVAVDAGRDRPAVHRPARERGHEGQTWNRCRAKPIPSSIRCSRTSTGCSRACRISSAAPRR